MWRTTTFSPRWWVVLLLLPVAAAGSLQVGWAFNGLYTQDAHAYLRLARELSAWWSGGARPGPAYWPLGYPTLGAVLAYATGDPLTALRIIPMLAWVALVLGFRRILLDRGAVIKEASLFTLLTVGTSPFLLRHGVVVMSDVPALALALWSLRFALVAPSLRPVLASFALAAAAVMVRLPMLAIVAPMVLVAGWRCWKGALEAQRAVLIAVLLACAVLVWWATASAVEHPLGQQSGLLNLFRRDFETVDGHRRFLVPNILFILKPLVHPGFLLLGPLLWAFFRRTDLVTWRSRLIAASLLAYALLIGLFPDQNDRLLLPVVPFAALLLWPAFQRLMAVSPIVRRRHVLVGAVVLLQLVLFTRAIAPFVRYGRIEHELCSWVKDQGAEVVYTFGVDQAMRSYGVEATLVDLWQREVDRFKPGALVLFNPSANAEQWKGRAPMLNWERAVVQGADTVGTRPDGWVLLRIR